MIHRALKELRLFRWLRQIFTPILRYYASIYSARTLVKLMMLPTAVVSFDREWVSN